MKKLKQINLKLDPPVVLDAVGYEDLVDRISEKLDHAGSSRLQALSITLEVEPADDDEPTESDKKADAEAANPGSEDEAEE